MSRLVENLLALARGDGQALGAESVPVDLALLLRELCTELAPAAHAKGLELKATSPITRFTHSGRRLTCVALFLILIDNAIKYTEAGSINLSLTSNDAHVDVTVREPGSALSRMRCLTYSTGFGARTRCARALRGAGLGLSLASQIVQRLGGTIYCGERSRHGAAHSPCSCSLPILIKIHPFPVSFQVHRS